MGAGAVLTAYAAPFVQSLLARYGKEALSLLVEKVRRRGMRARRGLPPRRRTVRFRISPDRGTTLRTGPPICTGGDCDDDTMPSQNRRVVIARASNRRVRQRCWRSWRCCRDAEKGRRCAAKKRWVRLPARRTGPRAHSHRQRRTGERLAAAELRLRCGARPRGQGLRQWTRSSALAATSCRTETSSSPRRMPRPSPMTARGSRVRSCAGS